MKRSPELSWQMRDINRPLPQNKADPPPESSCKQQARQTEESQKLLTSPEGAEEAALEKEVWETPWRISQELTGQRTHPETPRK